MTLIDHLSLFSPLDGIALLLLAISWFALGWLIEHPGTKRSSVTVLMADYRRDWMQTMLHRDPRIFDAQILSSLRQGTAFFASGCMIAIGGVLALVGNTKQLSVVATDLSLQATPALVWQMKLLVVVLLLTHGFLKFVWSNRVFGYCAVIMAAVPNDPTDPLAEPRAKKAAEINIRAALNFNRGLRSIYYALGTLAWFLGPIPLILAVAVVTWIIWGREFSSLPRQILLEEDRNKS